MDELVLVADTGRALGTRSSRRLRREGLVPGVVYGLDKEPSSVAVPWPDLRRVLTTGAGLNATISLELGGEKHLSIVKELQRHPVRRDVIHVDFLRVDPNVEVLVDVPIHLVGEARKVTDENGMVDQILFSVPVYAKPGSIPDGLEVDISALEVGDSVRIADVSFPAGSRTELDSEESVAVGMVTRSTIEAIAADEAAEAEADADEGADGAAAPEGGDDAEGGDED